jgi:hypothetical protein
VTPLYDQVSPPGRSAPTVKTEGRTEWAGFFLKLERADGTPAEPPTLHTAVPNWSPGEKIPLGRGRALRVIAVRPREDGDVLVVEFA